MLTLSPLMSQEKNKLNSDGVMIVMLEITIPSVTEVVRIANNNEDVTWSGETWQRFPFDIEDISENLNGETSQFSIKVSNINNVIGQYVRQYDAFVKINGFQAIDINIIIVNTKDLANVNPVFTTSVILSKFTINVLEVNFVVSAKDLFRINVPTHRMFPNSCRFKFKSTQCGYGGSQVSCDKTLTRCRELSNSVRYGAFPSIGNVGIVV